MIAKNIIETVKESRLLTLLTKKGKQEPVKRVSINGQVSAQEEDIRYRVGEVYWEAE